MTPRDGSVVRTPQGGGRPARAAGWAVGLPLMAVGTWTALAESERTRPFELASWVVGSDLVHDLVIAPLALGVGWIVSRSVPRPARLPVAWALATSAVFTMFAAPFVSGVGRDARVPSLLNRNYAQGLVVVMVVTWLAASAWAARRVATARRASERADGAATPPAGTAGGSADHGSADHGSADHE